MLETVSINITKKSAFDGTACVHEAFVVFVRSFSLFNTSQQACMFECGKDKKDWKTKKSVVERKVSENVCEKKD